MSEMRLGSAITLSRWGRHADVGRQGGTKATEGSGQARLDGAFWAVEGLSHLGFGEIKEEAVGQDETIVVAQPAQRRHQGGAKLIGLSRRLRGRGRFPRGLGRKGAPRQGGPTMSRQPAIACLVGDDPEK